MIEGTEIITDEKLLQNKPNASLSGTVAFRTLKDLDGCSIVLNVIGQLLVRQWELTTALREVEYSLLDFESRIWKAINLKAGYHKVPFKLVIKNAERLSPSMAVEDNIAISYIIRATFLRPNPIHPKQVFSVTIPVIQSTDFITQLLCTPTGFLITNKRDDSDSGYNSPSMSPMTTISVPSSSKSKMSFWKKTPTVSSPPPKLLINYELFSKKQTVVAGYTHSAELSWDFGDELPGQKSNFLKVRMMTVSFIQTTRVMKTTPTYEKSVVIQTYDIQFQGADATRTSQKIIAKVPANAAPSFESFAVTNFYMLKAEVFFEKKQKPLITVEAPVVVLSRSEGPADSTVKHSGLPYLEREDSLTDAEDDTASKLSLVTEDENITYFVNYPYSPHHPDEVELVPGDEVLVNNRFLDGYASITITKQAEVKSKAGTTANTRTVLSGIAPMHHLQETVERNHVILSLMNTDKASSRDSIIDGMNIPGLQLGPSAMDSRRSSLEIPAPTKGSDAPLRKRANTIDSSVMPPPNWNNPDDLISSRDSRYAPKTPYTDSYAGVSRDSMKSEIFGDINRQNTQNSQNSYRSTVNSDIYKRASVEQAYQTNSYYNPRSSQYSSTTSPIMPNSPNFPGSPTLPTLPSSPNFPNSPIFPGSPGMTGSPILQRTKTNESLSSEAMYASRLNSRSNTMQYKTVSDLTSPPGSPISPVSPNTKPSPHPSLSSWPSETPNTHMGTHVPPPTEPVEPIIVDEVVNLFTITAHFGVLTRFNALRYQSIKAEALLGGGQQPTPNQVPPEELNENIDVNSELFLDWLYLCRAEIRYEMWINYLATEQPNPRKMPLPPLDVALFWHAHLLNPLRYLEDIYRVTGQFITPYSFPLEQMHTVLGLGYEPDHMSLGIWNAISSARHTQQPFHLSALDNTTPLQYPCPWCKATTHHSPVKFVLFRIKNGFLNCANPKCQVRFDADSASAKLFLDDVIQWIKTQQIGLKGTNLNDQSCAIDPANATNFLSNLFFSTSVPSNDINNAVAILLGFSQPQSIASCNWETIQQHFAFTLFPALRATFQMKQVSENTFARLMRSYKDNVYAPFSIDLIAAVIRQRKFTAKMCGGVVNWSAPGVIPRATQRYAKFLKLIQEEKGRFLVPTLDIDLAWHTHQLFPYKYQIFGLNNIGRVLNHDDAIADDKLSKSFMVSTILWRKHFRERYASSSTTGPYVTPPAIMNSLHSPYSVYAVSRSQAGNDDSPLKRGACAFHDPTPPARDRRNYLPAKGVRASKDRVNVGECSSCGAGLVSCAYGKNSANGSGCAAGCGLAPAGSCVVGINGSVAPWSECGAENHEYDHFEYQEEPWK